jgi:polar amino acid transport system permease protein
MTGPRAVNRSAVAFAALTLLLSFFELDQTILGAFLAPAIGQSAESTEFRRLSVAAVVAFLLVANIRVIHLLPFRTQVLLVWLELLIVFLWFYYSFDLSYTFIQRKIGFMITQGAFTTVFISLVSILIACVIAMAGALAKLSSSPFAYGIATFYISFFRGIPLLMQVYLIYLGLPQLGFVVDAVPAGITALALCYGAYMAEIFRAGIQGVPHGQREAAAALGLHGGLIMRKIVLPQAMRLIVPPTGNQFIAMLKDSSLVSVVGVWELMFLARTQGRAEFKHLEMLITAAIIYWILSVAFEFVQSRIEAHYGKSDVRGN